MLNRRNLNDPYYARPANFAVKKDLAMIANMAKESRDSYRSGIAGVNDFSTALGNIKARNPNAEGLQNELSAVNAQLDEMNIEGNYEDYNSTVLKMAGEVARNPYIRAATEDYQNYTAAEEELADRRRKGEITDNQYNRQMAINDIFYKDPLEYDEATKSYKNISPKHFDTQRFVDMDAALLAMTTKLPKSYLGSERKRSGDGYITYVDKYGIPEDEIRKTSVDYLQDPEKDSWLEKESADDAILLTQGQPITKDLLKTQGLVNKDGKVVFINLKTNEKVIDPTVTEALYNEDGSINQETAFNYLTQHIKSQRINEHIDNAINTQRQTETISRVKDIISAERRANQYAIDEANAKTENLTQYHNNFKFDIGQTTKTVDRSFGNRQLEGATSDNAFVQIGNIPNKVNLGGKDYDPNVLIQVEHYNDVKNKIAVLKSAIEPFTNKKTDNPISDLSQGWVVQARAGTGVYNSPTNAKENKAKLEELESYKASLEEKLNMDESQLSNIHTNLTKNKEVYNSVKESAVLTQALQGERGSYLGDVVLSKGSNNFHRTQEGWYLDAFVPITDETMIDAETLTKLEEKGLIKPTTYYNSKGESVTGKVIDIKYRTSPQLDMFIDAEKEYGNTKANVSSFAKGAMDLGNDIEVKNYWQFIDKENSLDNYQPHHPVGTVKDEVTGESKTLTLGDLRKDLNINGANGIVIKYGIKDAAKLLKRIEELPTIDSRTLQPTLPKQESEQKVNQSWKYPQ